MDTISSSLSTALFGMSVVFAVLVGLILMIKLMNMAVVGSSNRKAAPAAAVQPAAQPVLAAVPASPALPTTLKLTDVDEQTAAIVMAIVCDEIGVPPNELYFKSIRLLGDQAPAQE